MTTSAPIQIRPMSRRNHLVFTLLGIVGIVTSLILQQQGIKLPAYLLLLAAFVLLVFGIFKWQEPEISIELTEQHFCWHFKYGSLQIPWSNIVDIRPLRVNKGQGQTDLHYLGLKLWDLTPVVDSISLRLAKSLFHEYRSLLHVALLEAQFRQDSTNSLQEDAEHWRDANGNRITGLKGMFAARLHQLKHYLGADLYIPVTSLDRHQDEFLTLFKQFQAKINQQSQTKELSESDH